MGEKKLRIIAGPNGSGKTTFINEVKNNQFFHLHHFINADEIQVELNKTNQFSFNSLFVTNYFDFLLFAQNSGLSQKFELPIIELFSFENNTISLKINEKSSYFAAIIADFIRHELLKLGKSFEYETVMSHESKIQFLKLAKKNNYKIYLYFLCTENPQINKLNVANRVRFGGHFVDENTIEKRYYKTLNLLFNAIQISDVAYVVQNNIKDFSLICNIKNNEIIELNNKIPWWFQKYYINKQNK